MDIYAQIAHRVTSIVSRVRRKVSREFFHLAESLRNTRSGGKEQDLFSLKYWKDDSSRTAFELSGWMRATLCIFEE